MHKVWPFILCGGVGTRLWPLSREAYPKQFHRLTGHETLFQETCRRFTGPLFGALWILANHRHRFLIAEQLEEIGLGAKNIVLEPVSRNALFLQPLRLASDAMPAILCSLDRRSR